MEIYQHAKVITGILVGFALTHLLGKLARLAQNQEECLYIGFTWFGLPLPSST
jgi:hypothetical protein